MTEVSAIFMASTGGHTACVELLSNRGAKANDADKNSTTVLMLVVERGYESCA